MVVHLAGLLGLRGDARRGGAALPGGLAREAIAFYSGLLLAVLALVSPLGYWSGTFIWVRVLQDIVLGVYVPPLIVLGAPWLVLWRGLGRAAAAPGPSVATAQPATDAAARAPAAQLAGRGDRPVRRGVVRLVRARAVRRRACITRWCSRPRRSPPWARACCSGCS